ncbi:MAG: hypothetical protein Q8L02_04030, partial [Candidatus Nitrotoga sp.]|nr:hypothetical protein [Candidatus Nitrotoga sp.]
LGARIMGQMFSKSKPPCLRFAGGYAQFRQHYPTARTSFPEKHIHTLRFLLTQQIKHLLPVHGGTRHRVTSRIKEVSIALSFRLSSLLFKIYTQATWSGLAIQPYSGLPSINWNAKDKFAHVG